MPFRQDFDSSIGMLLESLGYRRSAAHGSHTFVGGQDDPEFDALRKAAPHHNPITVFKNVKGQSRTREKNDVQRKKRYANRFHSLRSSNSPLRRSRSVRQRFRDQRISANAACMSSRACISPAF